MTAPTRRTTNRHGAVTAAVFYAVALHMAPVVAQESQSIPEPSAAPWRLLVQQQVKADKSCDLNEVLAFNELKLGKETVLEGRVSCIDGREFTFTRRREHQKFEFELCEPTVC